MGQPTAGPWHVDRRDREQVRDVRGVLIVRMAGFPSLISREAREANAGLIAQAPALRDALRQVIAWVDQHASAEGTILIIERARAALAAADGNTGESR